ncbi:unnamed protein product [Effrenium voratum]|uniref:ABC-type glycine betaine transport system substrate-binding domain-containing protein n=2 Tax=Effrenium voratum TaxID=2562239 RepID=A0AA36MTL8_9DINO|nr:unnamed protein product [Effrenium voratum]CAJ1424216.1 unnamed protein product [Effrenium voratum]
MVRLLVLSLLGLASAFCRKAVDREKLKRISAGGREWSFKLAYGSWSSPGPPAHVLRLLLEEEMQVHVTLTRMSSSAEMLKHVLGCTDGDGKLWSSDTNPVEAECRDDLLQEPPLEAWAAVEVWRTTSQSKLLLRQLGTGLTMGYQTFPGLYAQQTVIDEGLQGKVLLRWWESYAKHLGADQYFSSVKELDQAMYNLSFADPGCPDGWCPQGTIRPRCDSSLSPQEIAVMGEHADQCDGGWWYSRACTDRDVCVPVVLGEFDWNLFVWIEVLQDMPVALTWVGWQNEVQLVRRLPDCRFLFYWWKPDVTFLNLDPAPPVQVFFDPELSLQWVTAQLVRWQHLDEFAPEIARFLRDATFTDDDMSFMTSLLAQGASDEEAACAWLKNNTRYLGWIHQSEDDDTLLIALLSASMATCAALVLLLVLTFRGWLSCRDSPSDPATLVGQWTLKWAGPHVQARLDRKQSPADKLAWKCQSRQWLINASPFDIFFDTDSHGLFPGLSLSSYNFARILWRGGVFSVTLRDSSERSWKFRREDQKFQIHYEDWTRMSPSGQSYNDPCVRLPLKSGHLRIARMRSKCILVTWSPPAVSRGVPMTELHHFFKRVIDHPQLAIKEDAVDDFWNFAASFRSPVTAQQDPTQSRSFEPSTVNMYHALPHVIIPEAAVYDASWAEIHSRYGPANVFVSHVWGETAQNSMEALKKLYLWVKSQPRETCPTTFRAWFCTICNNQSRISEELGTEVMESPFYQVLSAPSCTEVGLVSPLLALNRKWCNFEFCLANSLNKPVWMVTSDGVVQAGAVPPKCLKDLADAVLHFHCKDAACSVQEDEKLIDNFVDSMGGYDALDKNLKDVFSGAIQNAHRHTEEAIKLVQHLHKTSYVHL